MCDCALNTLDELCFGTMNIADNDQTILWNAIKLRDWISQWWWSIVHIMTRLWLRAGAVHGKIHWTKVQIVLQLIVSDWCCIISRKPARIPIQSAFPPAAGRCLSKSDYLEAKTKMNTIPNKNKSEYCCRQRKRYPSQISNLHHFSSCTVHRYSSPESRV